MPGMYAKFEDTVDLLSKIITAHIRGDPDELERVLNEAARDHPELFDP